MFNEALALCQSGRYKLAGEFLQRCVTVSKGVAVDQVERLADLQRAHKALARARKAKGKVK